MPSLRGPRGRYPGASGATQVESLLREIERDRGVPVVKRQAGKHAWSREPALISAMSAAAFEENRKRSFAVLLTDGEPCTCLQLRMGSRQSTKASRKRSTPMTSGATEASNPLDSGRPPSPP